MSKNFLSLVYFILNTSISSCSSKISKYTKCWNMANNKINADQSAHIDQFNQYIILLKHELKHYRK